MPTTFCQFFYECTSCHELLNAKEGDCCVFCSYGDVPCPSKKMLSGAAPQPYVKGDERFRQLFSEHLKGVVTVVSFTLAAFLLRRVF
jgi:hypothetical protein